MGLWSRFNNNSDKEMFHSSGILGDTDAETLGTTSTETFEQRRKIERNRQLIGGYRDAGIIHNYRREAQHGPRQEKKHHYTPDAAPVPQRRPRIDVIKPRDKNAAEPSNNNGATGNRRPQGTGGRSPAAGVQPPRPTFHEPAGRRYNPYA